MSINKQAFSLLLTLAFMVVVASATSTFGQDANNIRTVPNGQEVTKFKGIVIKRNADSFVMRDPTGTGPETVVVLTLQTEVKSHKKGVFRGSKDYGVSYILRGLRLEVDGTGNADG